MENFKVVKIIGEGSYSSVYKVIRKVDDKEYALKRVKLLNLKEKEKENALNEIRLLASIKDENVVSYKEAFWEHNSNSLCIIMEYLDKGDLFQKITEHSKNGTYMKEDLIAKYIFQIAKGLYALHKKKIFHRDMKSANLFIANDNVIKIGDLNVSKICKKGLLYTQTGTPYYASPEVWRDKPYNEKSDIWSFGCIIYEMCTLKPPFRAEKMEGLYKKVLRGEFDRIPNIYSNDLHNLIKDLLNTNPKERPTCKEILSKKYITDRFEFEVFENFEYNHELLNTIKIPNNIHYLTDSLPKPNYEIIKNCNLKTFCKVNTKSIKQSNPDPNISEISNNTNLPNIKNNYKKETKSYDKYRNISNKSNKSRLKNNPYNPIINNYKKQNVRLKNKIEYLMNSRSNSNSKNLIQISGYNIKSNIKNEKYAPRINYKKTLLLPLLNNN